MNHTQRAGLPVGLHHTGAVQRDPAGRGWNASLALCKGKDGHKTSAPQTPVWVSVILNSAQMGLSPEKRWQISEWKCHQAQTWPRSGWMRCWNTARVFFSLGNHLPSFCSPAGCAFSWCEQPSAEPSWLQPGNDLYIAVRWITSFGNTVLYLFKYPSLFHATEIILWKMKVLKQQKQSLVQERLWNTALKLSGNATQTVKQAVSASYSPANGTHVPPCSLSFDCPCDSTSEPTAGAFDLLHKANLLRGSSCLCAKINPQLCLQERFQWIVTHAIY